MKKNILGLVMFLLLGFGVQAQSLQSNDQQQIEDKIAKLERQIAAVGEIHCEVPCGIYGDSLRVALMYEHVSTIEKAMAQINEISASEKPNYNQLVRWVVNKEKHAEEIQHIVSQYFLHQRVKLPAATADGKAISSYNNKLGKLHEILVFAMKSKQTTDQNFAEKMRASIHDFEHAYFGMHK